MPLRVATSGNRWVSPGTSVVDAPAVLGHEPAGDRAGPDDAHLLADHRADRGLVAVDLARDPEPGRRADQRADHRVAGELVVDGDRVAVGVDEATRPLDRGGRVAQVLERKRRGHERRLPRRGCVDQVEADGAVSVRQVEGPRVPTVSDDLHSLDLVVSQEVQEPSTGERGAYGEPHRDRAGARHTAAAASQGGGAGGVDLAHRLVELSDAGEAGRERDVGEAELGGLDEDPRRLGPPRACQGQRAGAELSGEQPAQVAGGVADPVREARDTLTVDDAVGDQPHRSTGGRRRDVPVGAARGGVGQAALAGAVAGAPGRRRRSSGRSRWRTPGCGPGTRGGSRSPWSARRCRTRRRSDGRATSPLGSRTRDRRSQC